MSPGVDPETFIQDGYSIRWFALASTVIGAIVLEVVYGIVSIIDLVSSWVADGFMAISGYLEGLILELFPGVWEIRRAAVRTGWVVDPLGLAGPIVAAVIVIASAYLVLLGVRSLA